LQKYGKCPLGQDAVMISNNRSKPAQPQIRKVWKTIRGGIEKNGKPDGGVASEKSLGKTVSRLKMDVSMLEPGKH
jgi:hypothetical protein